MTKAQISSILTWIALLFVFIIVYIIFLGPWQADVAQTAVTTGGYGGVEAFLLANWPLWTILIILLTIIIVAYGGNS